MKTAIERLAELDFKGGRITDTEKWGTRCFVLNGEFAGGDIKYFTVSFEGGGFVELEGCAGAVIEEFVIKKNSEEPYSVKLTLNTDGKTRVIQFGCKLVNITPKKYRGMSRRNMYETWLKGLENIACVENEKYFKGEETHELDEFTLNLKKYADKNIRLEVGELMGNGLRYRYRSTSYSNPHTFFDIIRHSDGRRYFPFHIDLYGISYLDVDSGRVYHYIPEGYEHDAEWDIGESFIVTDVHYDPRTNLIAYGGCVWAGPSDVMVGDFSEPLNFDPYLVSANGFIDPEYEECWDINFVRFEENGIVVRNNQRTEFLVGFDKIKSRLGGE